jgi:hypothetical protein
LLDSEVFPERSIKPQTCGFLHYPPLTFCALPEIISGYRGFLVHDGCKPIDPRKAHFLRLSAPSTLSRTGSLLSQGLPHPVCCAFRVSIPLSGLLLPEPVNPVSGPSVLGVFPFRVLFPLKSWSLSRGASLLALGSLAPGRECTFKLRLQGFVPFKERCSENRYCTESRTDTLLGFASLRLSPSDPASPFRLFSSLALSVHCPEDDDNKPGALEYFCRRTA